MSYEATYESYQHHYIDMFAYHIVDHGVVFFYDFNDFEYYVYDDPQIIEDIMGSYWSIEMSLTALNLEFIPSCYFEENDISSIPDDVNFTDPTCEGRWKDLYAPYTCLEMDPAYIEWFSFTTTVYSSEMDASVPSRDNCSTIHHDERPP